MIKRYLGYRLRARSRFRVHSPFLYTFLREVIGDKRWFYAFDDIESIRNELIQSDRFITRTDLGAGSKTLPGGNKKVAVSHIAAKSAVSPKQGRLLFRIVHRFQPNSVLELGTSLGISSLFLGRSNTEIPLTSIEGCPETAAIARETIEKGGLKKASILTGDFSEQLPLALEALNRVGCVFFDGNHRAEPTLSYFEQCLTKADDQSIFIFDDIHWSKEMHGAWKQITTHPEVKLSLDLFKMGVVLFRSEQREKEHYQIKW